MLLTPEQIDKMNQGQPFELSQEQLLRAARRGGELILTCGSWQPPGPNEIHILDALPISLVTDIPFGQWLLDALRRAPDIAAYTRTLSDDQGVCGRGRYGLPLMALRQSIEHAVRSRYPHLDVTNIELILSELGLKDLAAQVSNELRFPSRPRS
jgi:hypothetical protein